MYPSDERLACRRKILQIVGPKHPNAVEELVKRYVLRDKPIRIPAIQERYILQVDQAKEVRRLVRVIRALERETQERAKRASFKFEGQVTTNNSSSNDYREDEQSVEEEPPTTEEETTNENVIEETSESCDGIDLPLNASKYKDVEVSTQSFEHLSTPKNQRDECGKCCPCCPKMRDDIRDLKQSINKLVNENSELTAMFKTFIETYKEKLIAPLNKQMAGPAMDPMQFYRTPVPFQQVNVPTVFPRFTPGPPTYIPEPVYNYHIKRARF